MSPRAVRRIVIAVCLTGIAGMIAGSVADNNGTAITFGLLTAAAVLGLILVTSVAGPGAFAKDPPPLRYDEAEAEALESQISLVVARGAPEEDVRELVRRALAVARTVGPPR